MGDSCCMINDKTHQKSKCREQSSKERNYVEPHGSFEDSREGLVQFILAFIGAQRIECVVET